MATKAQIDANRENAKKSTGPRTPEGKKISSRNSLVHGMTSGKFLPPGGDPNEFFQLLDQFRDRFQPVDTVEDALVERLAAAEFKMRSVRYLDAGIFHNHGKVNPVPAQLNEGGAMDLMAWAFEWEAGRANTFIKLVRYEGALQREFSRTLRELFMLQDERRARAAASETPAGKPESPPANPKTEKTKQTQSPGPAGAAIKGLHPDDPRNAFPDLFHGGRDDRQT